MRKVIQEVNELRFFFWNRFSLDEFNQFLKIFRVVEQKEIEIEGKETKLSLFIVGESHIWQYGEIVEVLSCQEINEETIKPTISLRGEEISSEGYSQDYEDKEVIYKTSASILPFVKPIVDEDLKKFTLFHRFPGDAYTMIDCQIQDNGFLLSTVHTYPNENKTVLTKSEMTFRAT